MNASFFGQTRNAPIYIFQLARVRQKFDSPGPILDRSNLIQQEVSCAIKSTYKGFYQGYQFAEVDYVVAGIIENS
jgi:hypothetical protein